ncbi:MAG: COQ9 family protein [Pseudomonadota bacterium]
MTTTYPDADAILDAALLHVPFDGWSDITLRAALRDLDTPGEAGRLAFPRGALDLALAFHRRGDVALQEALKSADLDAMKIREKVAFAVRTRIELASDKEAVRRGVTFFALPQNSVSGATAIWETADAIWDGIGDTSRDANWYSKRAILSGVYSSTVLFWLGDDSIDTAATWAFLDRRIDNVMQFEKLKAQVTKNPVLQPLMAGPNWLASKIRAPENGGMPNMPGFMRKAKPE